MSKARNVIGFTSQSIGLPAKWSISNSNKSSSKIVELSPLTLSVDVHGSYAVLGRGDDDGHSGGEPVDPGRLTIHRDLGRRRDFIFLPCMGGVHADSNRRQMNSGDVIGRVGRWRWRVLLGFARAKRFRREQ